jgi:hypothetical protein
LKKNRQTPLFHFGQFLSKFLNRANQNAVNAFIVPFGLISLLNNNFALQFLYPSHIFALKNIRKNKNNSLPTDPISKSEVTRNKNINLFCLAKSIPNAGVAMK